MLLADVGKACAKYQNEHLTRLTSKRIQCDEIWSFCYAKQKNIPEDKQGAFGYGDVWTWVALDADTKLTVSFLVGLRNIECATHFVNDLKDRLANRIQLSTDGYKVYLNAVDNAFGSEVDYAILNKLYGKDLEQEKRYSLAKCIGIDKKLT